MKTEKFTVIGDVVNVANRVCDICGFKCDFVVTEDLKNRLNETLNAEEVKDYAIRVKKIKSLSTKFKPNAALSPNFV